MGIAFQFLTQLFVERFATLALIKLFQSSVIMELDYMPKVAKTTKAIHQLSSDKILGEDGIAWWRRICGCAFPAFQTSMA